MWWDSMVDEGTFPLVSSVSPSSLNYDQHSRPMTAAVAEATWC